MHSQPQGPQYGQQGPPPGWQQPPQGWAGSPPQGPPQVPYQPPRPPGGRRRKQGGKVGWWIAGGVAVVGAVMIGGGAVLAALGNAPQTRPLSATSAPQATPDTGVPTPDAEARTAFLGALAGIDEGLTVNEQRAISRGRSTCLDLRAGKSSAQVVANTRQRFTGGNAQVSNADARRIVAAVRVWCG